MARLPIWNRYLLSGETPDLGPDVTLDRLIRQTRLTGFQTHQTEKKKLMTWSLCNRLTSSGLITRLSGTESFDFKASHFGTNYCNLVEVEIILNVNHCPVE